MDLEGLLPAQRRVVEELMAWPERGSRPPVDLDLAPRLRDTLEAALGQVTASLGVGELYVSKRTLAGVLACEAHHRADSAGGFPGWSPRLARGTVMHKAIELSVHMPPDTSPGRLAGAAIDALVADGGARSPGPWLAALDEVELAELTAGVSDGVGKFLESWPRLEDGWWPRTESAAWLELCDRRITLHAKVDLTLGRPSTRAARVLIVDFKTGLPHARHMNDLRFYALVHTIRTGIAPFRIASYYLDGCAFNQEDVTEDSLVGSALPRLVEGITRMTELHLGLREPRLQPGPACGWCSLRSTCPGASEWAERHGEWALDDGSADP